MSLRDDPALSPTTARGTAAKFYSPNDQSEAFITNAAIRMPDGSSWASVAWNILSEGVPEYILTRNTKFETPINIEQVAGEINTLVVTQSSVGGLKASWGAAFDWGIDGEPVLAQGPNARTILQFYCTGAHLLGNVFYRTPESDSTIPSTI